MTYSVLMGTLNPILTHSLSKPPVKTPTLSTYVRQYYCTAAAAAATTTNTTTTVSVAKL